MQAFHSCVRKPLSQCGPKADEVSESGILPFSNRNPGGKVENVQYLPHKQSRTRDPQNVTRVPKSPKWFHYVPLTGTAIGI